ncbi:tRNA-specific adenosine deaminase 1 [Conger conger]|uniref:tRNA-specific adenosine deaminase 1 n=1 Tax=Conger conger TaxID=82655 RepID=UPI002A5A30D0|nr:tRNA-specific adenosine deaminase 1 [Conger conger]XP_061078443.1 tRNA-specific adenosine deaminase 1 [Conger conger]XP_061078444.1 tRNA-specific adenosine deaminase 1 [Conger conger]
MWSPDEIARLCYNRFNELPKRGKPELGREWTLLAAVVKLSEAQSQCQPKRKIVEKEVVSLGTGTKCIGQSAMSPRGDVLNDSHAEVIARRGFVRYLTEELRRAVVGEGSRVFCPGDETGKWRLLDGVSFVFFTSHTPCGDASIIPMTDSQSQPCLPVGTEEGTDGTNEAPGVTVGGGALRRLMEEEEEEGGGACKRPRLDTEEEEEEEASPKGRHSPAKRSAKDPDIPALGEQAKDVHRTGAKCVPGAPADPREGGPGYHSVGALRVKPGRGERTRSLSCSDKMARWAALGCQGALLSHYLQGALRFSAVVTGKCPYSPEAMRRALSGRCAHVTGLPAGYELQPVQLLQSSVEFTHSQGETERCHQQGQGRVSPCGAAISWCAVADQPLDVTANGYKQGVTKTYLGTEKSRSLICKAELFHCFLNLLAVTEDSQLPPSLRGKELSTYWDYKRAAQTYQQAWLQLRTQAFPLWLRCPRDLLLFQ